MITSTGSPSLRAPNNAWGSPRRGAIPGSACSSSPGRSGARTCALPTRGSSGHAEAPEAVARFEARGPVPQDAFARARYASVTAAPQPPPLLSPDAMLSVVSNPMVYGTAAVIGVAAGVRQMLKVSPAQAASLLKEAHVELDAADVVMAVAERKLAAASHAAISVASVEAKRAALSAAYARSSDESAVVSKHSVAATAGRGVAVAERPWLPSPSTRAVSPSRPPAPPAPPKPKLASPKAAVVPEVVGADPTHDASPPSRMQQILGRVGDILGLLERTEEKQAATADRLKATAKAQTQLSASDVAAAAAAIGADRASPLGSHSKSAAAAAPAGGAAAGAAAGAQPPSPSASPPVRPYAAPSPSSSPASNVVMAPRPLSPKALDPPRPPSPTPTWGSPPEALPTSPALPVSPPSPPQPVPAQARLPPVPTLAPAPMPPPVVHPRLPATSSMTTSAIKCRMLDVVYGTQRGVSASLDERGEVEELVAALEARNPNSVVTDAVAVMTGRWKLIYTSNTQTLMLLNAIQMVPMVDIGDVYQLIDGETMTAHNKIDLALPVLMSLRADTGMEVRTPHSYKVRFHRIGVDTFIETPQLIAALEVPESVEVLGQTIDLTPLRRFLIEPVQSGLGTATELMRRAASPELMLPAFEANSLFMLTTYLDDNLRVSRDDNGSLFVMLRDV
ncbi:hypothetical protein FOA52_005561 [Chlamydomonas sp. UWO 241]|nr:hypothetical protein FOA52_005561 [Chlamydomonas sp. UWO 241]